MIKHKNVMQYVAEIEDVLCDSCGESCYNGYNYEYLTLSNNWGYGSKYDLQAWEAHVCEKCIDKLSFINFKKSGLML